MPKTSGLWRTAYTLPALAVMAGCVTAKYVPIAGAYPSRGTDCALEVFSAGPPDREYQEIGILEAEGSLWKADLEDVFPRLREEACLAGGDALVLLSANKYARGHEDGVDEAELYAIATVVRWRQR